MLKLKHSEKLTKTICPAVVSRLNPDGLPSETTFFYQGLPTILKALQ